MIRSAARDFITEWLEARQCANQPALSDGEREIGIMDLRERIDGLARTLLEAGIGRHDLVAYCYPHGLEQAVLILALLKAGVVGMSFGVNPAKDRLEELTRQFRPSFVLSPPSAKDPAPRIRRTEHAGPAGEPRRALFERHGAAWCLLTSGSTGARKAVVIGADDLATRARGEAEAFGLTARDRILNYLPYSHDLGLNQLLSCAFAGATLVVDSGVFLPGIVTKLSDLGITGVTSVPLTWRRLLAQPELLAGRDFANLRYLTVSGGSLPPDALLALRGIFPRVTVFKTYGQTETFRSLLGVETWTEDSLGSIGTPLPGVRVELSEDGELIHSGAGTMLGYLDSPDFGETTRVPTGDLFARGPDGAYRYLGRRDDMIKINGNRIYPREIELELARHPAVADCTVLPLGQDIDLSAGPGSDGGVPRLAAFVVPRQGAEVTGAELQAHCRSRLEGWAIPDRFVLLAELPRTESHKPDRTALRALL